MLARGVLAIMVALAVPSRAQFPDGMPPEMIEQMMREQQMGGKGGGGQPPPEVMEQMMREQQMMQQVQQMMQQGMPPEMMVQQGVPPEMIQQMMMEQQMQGGKGGQPGMQQFQGRQQKPLAPKPPSKKVHPSMDWLKGTTWKWADWKDITLNADQTFECAEVDSSEHSCNVCPDLCTWSTGLIGKLKQRIYLYWGNENPQESSLITMTATAQVAESGTMLNGKSHDGMPVKAKFTGKAMVEQYAVLGLTPDASPKQIKKAYHKLSMKLHPDRVKGGDKEAASEKFKHVAEAYDILSSVGLKFLYDSGGAAAVTGYRTDMADREQAKREWEKGGDVRMQAAARGYNPNEMRKLEGDSPEPTNELILVSLEQIANGAKIRVPYTRNALCRGCKNSDEGECAKCTQCSPRVNRNSNQQQLIPTNHKCTKEKVYLELRVERGQKDGTTQSFPHMAEQIPGQIPGTVIITMKHKKHKVFTRDGHDLTMRLDISLRQALLGFNVRLPHPLKGHTVVAANKGVASNGQSRKEHPVLVLRGEGMPKGADEDERGDLHATLFVRMPQALTEAQAQAIAEHFPEEEQ